MTGGVTKTRKVVSLLTFRIFLAILHFMTGNKNDNIFVASLFEPDDGDLDAPTRIHAPISMSEAEDIV